MALTFKEHTKKPKHAAPLVEVEAPAPVHILMKHKVQVAEQAELTDLEKLTVEYIQLYQKFAYFDGKALLSRMEEIRKQLVAVANQSVDDGTIAIFSSPQGEIEFSARGKTNTVPEPLVLVNHLLEKFGAEATETVVDIAITPLRKLLSDYELKSYLKEEPGSRTLKAVRPV